VSRVYNLPGSVTAEKREAVLNAAAELGYVPNKAASSLRRQGSGQVLFLELQRDIPNYWSMQRYYRWFLADAIQASMEVVNGSMYQLSMDVWRVHEDPGPTITHHRPDAIICYDIENDREAQEIHRLGLPYVLTWHVEFLAGYSRATTDNYHGGYVAGTHLREMGHRRVVYVTNESFNPAVHAARLDGFRAGLESPEVAVVRTGAARSGGYDVTEDVLRLLKASGATAIAAVNDITAIGIANGLMLHGLRIPHDVSLIGYDDMPMAAALPFELTSVRLRIDEMYRRATEALLDTIREPGILDLKVDPTLVPGDSVAPMRQRPSAR
jgi:LacI family transcriptional regulator